MKPCLYVGMTGLPVEHRFENHKRLQIRVDVKKYGIRLMPELYEHLNPMPFEAAAQMEKDLTKDLRDEGTPSNRWNVRFCSLNGEHALQMDTLCMSLVVSR